MSKAPKTPVAIGQWVVYYTAHPECRPYYFHSMSNTTQWEIPQDIKAYNQAPPLPVQSRPVDQEAAKQGFLAMLRDTPVAPGTMFHQAVRVFRDDPRCTALNDEFLKEDLYIQYMDSLVVGAAHLKDKQVLEQRREAGIAKVELRVRARQQRREYRSLLRRLLASGEIHTGSRYREMPARKFVDDGHITPKLMFEDFIADVQARIYDTRAAVKLCIAECSSRCGYCLCVRKSPTGRPETPR